MILPSNLTLESAKLHHIWMSPSITFGNGMEKVVSIECMIRGLILIAHG